MPTTYQPQLSQSFGYTEVAQQIDAALSLDRDEIFKRLNFHVVHGEIGEFGGNYDDQIRTDQGEVLREIAGCLLLAADAAAALSDGVIIATLNRVQKDPHLVLGGALPAAVEYEITESYQRTTEKPGTHWPDVIGMKPNGFQGRKRRPSKRNIIKAAAEAVKFLQGQRNRGRPANEANKICAERLGPLWLRYNDRVGRRSERDLKDGKPVQFEVGPFYDFLEVVLRPLHEILRIRRLSPVTAAAIARLASR